MQFNAQLAVGSQQQAAFSSKLKHCLQIEKLEKL
jgi:hypothetical protein